MSASTASADPFSTYPDVEHEVHEVVIGVAAMLALQTRDLAAQASSEDVVEGRRLSFETASSLTVLFLLS